MSPAPPFDHAAVMEDAAQTTDAEHEELERRLQLVESRRARRVAARLAVRERRSVLLVVPVAMLLIIGLGAMLSASSVISIRETGDHLFYFKRQIVWVALGLVAFLAAMRIPYR